MAAKKRKKTRSQRQADARRRQGGGGPVTVEAPAPAEDAARGRGKAGARGGTKAEGKGKGGSGKAAGRAAPVRKGPITHKASLAEAPPPIWHPFPLTEILILVGMVVAIIGLFTQSISMLVGGLLVLGASSTELAVREHFAGYRSHSAMIAGLVAMGVGTALAFLLGALDVGIPVWTVLVVAAIVFAVLFFRLRDAFVRRTGLTFRV